MRAKEIRTQVHRLVEQRPFRPFRINLENGDRITIEHPENIAFDLGSDESEGSFYFYVVSNGIWFGSTFHAVTGVVQQDVGEPSQA